MREYGQPGSWASGNHIVSIKYINARLRFGRGREVVMLAMIADSVYIGGGFLLIVLIIVLLLIFFR